MNPSLVSIVLIGAVIFYAAAIMLTYESFALYGVLTLVLVGLSLMPLLVDLPAVKGMKKDLKKRK